MLKKIIVLIVLLFFVQPVHADPIHFIEGTWELDTETTIEHKKNKYSQRWNEEEEELLRQYLDSLEQRRYTFNIEERKVIVEGGNVKLKYELEIKGMRLDKSNIFYFDLVGQKRDFTMVVTLFSWEKIGMHAEQPDALDDKIWKRIKSPNADESHYQYHKEMFEKSIETKDSK